MATILVTGAAGFIGYHTAERLLSDGHTVVGLDNLNDYYEVALKRARLERLASHAAFRFERLDLADTAAISELVRGVRPERVVHLGAQAGVRYSLENPHSYAQANLVGFVNVLEACRHNDVAHLVYASSSSVYGDNPEMPFSEHGPVDHPMSLYGATKKANEVMAHSYSHLFDLPTTGLRFFTVYGPWGRPDMALFLFTRAILAGEPIRVFNRGEMSRDFTYVDDVVEGIVRVTWSAPQRGERPEQRSPATSDAPFRLYNIGHSSPVGLMDMIRCLEEALGRGADKELLPMQPGDVPATWADATDLAEAVGYRPTTPLAEGVRAFVAWYRDYYGV